MTITPEEIRMIVDRNHPRFINGHVNPQHVALESTLRARHGCEGWHAELDGRNFRPGGSSTEIAAAASESRMLRELEAITRDPLVMAHASHKHVLLIEDEARQILDRALTRLATMETITIADIERMGRLAARLGHANTTTQTESRNPMEPTTYTHTKLEYNVTAMQWDGTNAELIATWLGGSWEALMPAEARFMTRMGRIQVHAGEYIAVHPNGVINVWNKEVFEAEFTETTTPAPPMIPEIKLYITRPETAHAVQWNGTAEGATPIIDWVLEIGGTARYHSGGTMENRRQTVITHPIIVVQAKADDENVMHPEQITRKGDYIVLTEDADVPFVVMGASEFDVAYEIARPGSRTSHSPPPNTSPPKMPHRTSEPASPSPEPGPASTGTTSPTTASTASSISSTSLETSSEISAE